MKLSLEKVKKYYGKGGHDLNHIIRVYKNSLKIAKTVKCDVEVVKAAALLHDIARNFDEKDIKGLCHAVKGAEMAQEILKDYDYTLEQKNNIIHCIRVHRYSKGLKPESIEAEILQDADRLDALGAIIITRVFYQSGKVKGIMHDPEILPGEYKGAAGTTTSINHFYEKILKITPDRFNTDKGKELANVRYGFVEKFIEQFLKEWDCKI